MKGITMYLSILTMNVNGLNSLIKRHLLQTGLKWKIQKSDVYRRPISLRETSTALGWKAGRRVTKPMASKTGRSSNIYLRQSRVQTYIDQMRY
jgi:hypothetical protein